MMLILYIISTELFINWWLGVTSFDVPTFVGLLRNNRLSISQQKCRHNIRLRSMMEKENGSIGIDSQPTDNKDLNTKSRSCCIITSPDYQNVAQEVSERLIIPLVQNITDLKQFEHALVIEPYSYGVIKNYTIGIISLLDSATVSLLTRQLQKNRQQQLLPKDTANTKPLFIDFMPLANSKLGRRVVGSNSRSSSCPPDLLLKAIRPNQIRTRNNGNTDSNPVLVYDMTAGFGQDSLLIAHAIMANKSNDGGRIHMIERNPIIATLLQDALRRLKLIADFEVDANQFSHAQHLLQCLSFEFNDGINVLSDILENKQSHNPAKPDIIYLDPMFPIRKKTASVKKNMQILHTLLCESADESVHTDTEYSFIASSDSRNLDESVRHVQEQKGRKHDRESMLLQLAYDVANCRVVVKRPIHAPPINASHNKNGTENLLKPSYQISGSINRWDVYTKY